MLKGSRITALILTLMPLFATINTSVARSQQTAEGVAPVINKSKGGKPKPPCKPKPNCTVISPTGNTPNSPLDKTTPTPPIPITRPELNNVTSAVAIEKLEALIASGQATNDDYILLGFFYRLEKKYDLSRVNYLKALELATDDARKVIIEQEINKLPAVM